MNPHGHLLGRPADAVTAGGAVRDPGRWTIVAGDCVAAMGSMAESCADAIVTDPPYGLEFMGKHWDRLTVSNATGVGSWATGFARTDYADGANRLPRPVYGSSRNPMCRVCRRHRYGSHGCTCESPQFDEHPADSNRLMQEWHLRWARQALRVLKPGGHLLAFGGCRTFHRLACALEDAGFELRDILCWLFGSGFPKNRQLGAGWGTALKPGYEPIVLARRPCEGLAKANFAKYGTGGLHIGACGIVVANAGEYERNCSGDRGHAGTRPASPGGATSLRVGGGSAGEARWPANVVLDEAAAAQLDEQCGASRFFYCAKSSRAERNAGLGGFSPKAINWSSGERSPGTFQAPGTQRLVHNHHPTVKPIELMRWLSRLVTPAGGLILDPFAGSGTTGIAAVLEGFEFTGIEREAEYAELAEARIRWWEQHRPGADTSAILAAAAERPGPEQLRLEVF